MAHDTDNYSSWGLERNLYLGGPHCRNMYGVFGLPIQFRRSATEFNADT